MILIAFYHFLTAHSGGSGPLNKLDLIGIFIRVTIKNTLAVFRHYFHSAR